MKLLAVQRNNEKMIDVFDDLMYKYSKKLESPNQNMDERINMKQNLTETFKKYSNC